MFHDFLNYMNNHRNPRKMRINMNARNIDEQSANKQLLDYLNNDMVTPDQVPAMRARQDDNNKKVMRIKFG